MSAVPRPPSWARDLTGWQCPTQVDVLELLLETCPAAGCGAPTRDSDHGPVCTSGECPDPWATSDLGGDLLRESADHRS